MKSCYGNYYYRFCFFSKIKCSLYSFAAQAMMSTGNAKVRWFFFMFIISNAFALLYTEQLWKKGNHLFFLIFVHISIRQSVCIVHNFLFYGISGILSTFLCMHTNGTHNQSERFCGRGIGMRKEKWNEYLNKYVYNLDEKCVKPKLIIQHKSKIWQIKITKTNTLLVLLEWRVAVCSDFKLSFEDFIFIW